MANLRIQFSLKQNVQISQYTSEIFDRFDEEMQVEDTRPNIAFRREGNLFLVDETSRSTAEALLDLQQGLGCEVVWLDPEAINARYPLYKADQYGGGTLGPRDGHFDAYAVLMAYKAKAVSQGAAFLAGEAAALRKAGDRSTGVHLASGDDLQAGCVVNAAGAWASDVARSIGVHLPIRPVKRQIFVLDTAVKPVGPLPLTVLPSGLYFRTDTGGVILLGKSMDEDPVGFDFSWDEKRFMDVLWPELAEFVPAFDTLKLIRGWAGLYAVNTLDSNAILGEWPEVGGLFLANGFSGHGLQQAPAVGRYLTELITGRKPSLDLSIFGPERILEKRPIREDAVV